MSAVVDSIHSSRTPDRGPHDEAAGDLREQAIEKVSERIKDGKGRVGIRDLIDCELDNPDRCRIMAEEFGDLLCATDDYARAQVSDRIIAGLIERHLSTPQGKESIEDEANEIEASEDEDDAFERSRHEPA